MANDKSTHTNRESKIKFVQELKKQYADKKKIISNYDYITWLENFTKTYPSFAEDTWLYQPEKISENDYSNVVRILTFFDAIRSYCHHFYICTPGDDAFESERIHITHNHIGYQLSCFSGQGTFVVIKREEPPKDAIKFSDIVNYNAPANFETKKELLEQFEKLILTMQDADVPYGAMMDIIWKHYK